MHVSNANKGIFIVEMFLRKVCLGCCLKRAEEVDFLVFSSTIFDKENALPSGDIP